MRLTFFRRFLPAGHVLPSVRTKGADEQLAACLRHDFATDTTADELVRAIESVEYGEIPRALGGGEGFEVLVEQAVSTIRCNEEGQWSEPYTVATSEFLVVARHWRDFVRSNRAEETLAT